MYGFIITIAGEGLLARASAGEGLTITEVWVGKGTVESAEAAKAPPPCSIRWPAGRSRCWWSTATT
ncbi:MAG: hypothetical protein ACLS63_07125 [Flavonifractor plautii]